MYVRDSAHPMREDQAVPNPVERGTRFESICGHAGFEAVIDLHTSQPD